jgi:signal transduction histidine kinase
MPLDPGGSLAALFYIRLIALTAGTLVYLFLLALIVGHRRPRYFERLLFGLNFCLFLIYAGFLLEINARIEYATPSALTIVFARTLVSIGLVFLLPLSFHSFAKYQEQIRTRRVGTLGKYTVWTLYAFAAITITACLLAVLSPRAPFSLSDVVSFISHDSMIVLASSALACMFCFGFTRTAKDSVELAFFRAMSVVLLALTVFALALVVPWGYSGSFYAIALTALFILGFVPGAVLLYFALRRNFLEYGAQRNLMYALPVTLLALLYLALVRRVGQWLEPVVPPEATASVLLFVLIFLFEPLERVIGPLLQKRFQEGVSGVQKLNVELQATARQGNLAALLAEAERRIREDFGLAVVRVTVPLDPARTPLQSPGKLGHVVQIPLAKGSEVIGALEAASTGSFLTGETTASLQLVADQLPSMIDLSRLIEDKVRLERELAERERLASLGQMAASVSHNLRNPLSSMKTVLQVQLENPDLPVDIRRDCALVVTEIDRMSAKLTQLLRYAKPSVSGERVAAVTLARQTAVLFRHDAERRNVRLEFEQPSQEVYALASEDSLSEVLSNLIVNAIEAQPNGGRVRVSLAQVGQRLEIVIEDDGPGISPELRAKIFQPYFTTKPTGTGLGLSIVSRRVDEMSGTLACESPLRDGKGARFRLSFPVAPDVDAAPASTVAGEVPQ